MASSSLQKGGPVRYKKLIPRVRLRPYVESIWCQEDLKNAAFENYAPTKVLPSGKVDILFHFRDPFIEFNGDEAEMRPRSYVAGQRTKPSYVAATGQTGIIIVNFRPWSASAFFGVGIDEIKDLCIDLRVLTDPVKVAVLEDRLQEKAKISERIFLVEEFLCGILTKNRIDGLVARSTLEMAKDLDVPNISQLAKWLNISRRHFIRRFKRSVGLGPKQFANIIRFQKAVQNAAVEPSWSQVAMSCGYFDQSHLIKEFRRFSGLSPREMISRHHETALSKYFNDRDNSSHFYNTKYL